MLGIAQKPARAARCEQLVYDYPQAARDLLAYFVREQNHDEFFTTTKGVHRDTWPAINILRSMIARAEGRRLLADIAGGG